MPIDFGGVSALSQSVLAVNMAYLALTRFQYRPEVQRIFHNAAVQSLKQEHAHHDTLAADYVRGLEVNKEAWGSAQFAYWCYSSLFQCGRDRRTCAIFSLIATLWLIFHACAALMFPFLYDHPAYTGMYVYRAILLGTMTIGMACPVLFWALGRHAIACATAKMEEYTARVGKEMKNLASGKVVEAMQRLEDTAPR